MYMRLAVVFLNLSVIATVVSAQYPYPSQGVVSGSAPARADGTPFNEPFYTTAPAERLPAAISFQHFVHQPPKKAVRHFDRAMKALRHDAPGEALDRLTDAVQLDPEFFEAQLRIGALFIDAGLPAQALRALEQALRLDPSSQAAQALAGYTLLALDRPEEAELALKRSRQLGHSLPIIDELLRFARTRRLGLPDKQGTTP
jgi:tetratricopeptide (TPR) repeat protein